MHPITTAALFLNMPNQLWAWALLTGSMFMLGAVGVALVIRCVRAPGDVRRAASCGGCGHEIVDVATGVCPECGGNLLRCGVMTPRGALRMRGSPWMIIAGWTLAIAAIALPSTTYLDMVLIATRRAQQSALPTAPVMKWNGMIQEPSQIFGAPMIAELSSQNDDEKGPFNMIKARFDVDITINEWNSSGAGTITLKLANSSTPRGTLVVHADTKTATLTDVDDKEIASDLLIEEKTILQWLALADLDIDDRRVQRGAQDVLKMIETTLETPLNSESRLARRMIQTIGRQVDMPELSIQTNGVSQMRTTPVAALATPSIRWPWILAIATIASVYIIGIILLIALRNRTLRAV
ncbi:MAG: hypothetical protein R3B58_08140 [Phycisphaerales bacterium]